ncbi:hypothetical protein EV363DRAFT_1265552 [Boletus edulis]|nr:hypothetical protein EV363DRAFT_1265552 [Boletus edulis]
MVGSFHGHAHNRLCQLQWHPMYIEGIGNMEGEGCKHVFSASNELARTIHHATRFHRYQAIEEHFTFWNADKYEALTTFCFLQRFIRNHYRDAIDAIRSLSSELAVLKQTLNLCNEDFQCFLSKEQVYLSSVKQPQPREQFCIQYVQVLDELETQRTAWLAAREKSTVAVTSVAPMDLTAATVAIRNAQIKCELTFMKLQQTTILASHIQGQLSLAEPWTIGYEEYNLYKEEVRLSQYRKALGELEHLVVMRLFELTKALLTGTGKSRTDVMCQSE